MPLKILIAPDKFKGTLTASEAASAIAQGWRTARPQDDLDLLPMSDGGDGFGEILSQLLGAQLQSVKTIDAAHRPADVPWWWHPPTRTAIVEAARIIGLAMLPHRKYHPFELDTFGLGTVLGAAANLGAVRCLVGVGGSATNDAGFGMARSLGWQFFNARDKEITRWTELHRLVSIRLPGLTQLFEDLMVAVDVQNPLLGPSGCSRVYGPQKGLTEFEFAERCLGQLAAVLAKQFHRSHADTPGAGAGGGLGFGLLTFAGARVESGIGIFAQYARLKERVKASQLVITGEGKLDAQSLMGKGVGEIATLCESLGVPCVGLAGTVAEPAAAAGKFQATYALTPGLTDQEAALREPAVWLERLAAGVAARWSPRIED
jgi:glycerate kinase